MFDISTSVHPDCGWRSASEGRFEHPSSRSSLVPGRAQRCPAFGPTTDLAPVLSALDDVIAEWRQHEMHFFHGLQNEEGHGWAGRIDELLHIRDLIQRVPHQPLRVK